MKRRQFLALATRAALAAGAGAGAVTYAYHCAVTRRAICLPGLAPAFEGFRIALLSDFHHSPWIPRQCIRAAVALANSLKPDLIALTGDYIHRGSEWVPGCMRELARLRAAHGVVAVLGNHDHYAGASQSVLDGLRRAGLSEITNRGIALQRGGDSLHVAGVGDWWCQKQRLERALRGARHPGSVILLQHNPDYVEHLRDERVGLVLSGHTHGGQCNFPLIGPPILPSRFGQKYASGLCQGPVAPVFVTRGVGASFPPIRFRCPPEVALLTLRAGGTA